jgi:uncharacterized protein YndB with AHSA1/START domain
MHPPKILLTAETLVHAKLEDVWQTWTDPEYIKLWNRVSDDWHTPRAENDLRVGGKMILRMEKKDGTDGFDFEVTYDEMIVGQKISYTVSDGRTATIWFTETPEGVALTEEFEPTTREPAAFQQAFCQSILNNFKACAENKERPSR